MKSDQRKEIGQWLVVLLLIVTWLIWVWPTPYEHLRLGSQEVRTNRFTGTMQYLTPNGWSDKQVTQTATPVPMVSLEPPKPLNPTAVDLENLNGKGGFLNGIYVNKPLSLFRIDAYNGSNKPLQGSILVHVIIKNKKGEVVNDRKIRTDVDIPPQTVHEIQVDTGLEFDPVTQKIEWYFEPVSNSP